LNPRRRRVAGDRHGEIGLGWAPAERPSVDLEDLPGLGIPGKIGLDVPDRGLSLGLDDGWLGGEDLAESLDDPGAGAHRDRGSGRGRHELAGTP
jgi:hypothetical protein